ncbi:GM26791 [Drosophila sechellia]|uniref:GM26791 n=1 Tax=Drosophila sechellia TaxID=7238 RepID=B4IIV3_DROSE|nr:GM26791 [Drosophila sechellia]
MVPIFVNNCIDYLEENGLQQVGLFRVSTSKKRVKQLREDFDKDIYFGISVDTCPHDVATLLKEFLRDLPEPLLCNTLYLTFLKTQRIRNRRLQLEAISHLIRLLPIPHRDTLYVLLVFLAKVAAHSDDIWSTEGCCLTIGNKMDSNNLATVFAPNILRSTHLTFSRDKEQENMSDAINVVRFVKQNTCLLFLPLMRQA